MKLTDFFINYKVLYTALSDNNESYSRGYIFPHVFLTNKYKELLYSLVEFKFGFGVFSNPISIEITENVNDFQAYEVMRDNIKLLYKDLIK